MSLTVTAAPALEPVTRDELKTHLRLDPDGFSEDTYLDTLIETAREYAETLTARTFITTSLRLDLDAWPCGSWLHLPRPPLQSVTAVQYLDETGTLQTWASSNYVEDAPSGSRAAMGRWTRAPDIIWPSLQSDAIRRVRIAFDAGYGDAAGDVPAGIRQAILLLAAEAYEQRREVVVGVSTTPAALAARNLLAPYRVLSA